MIVTLCGSAKFERLFHIWNEVLTLSGHTVFALSVYPSWKDNNKNWYTKDEKKLLDEAHLRKIQASDAILVLNKFAYIGESTLAEITFAEKSGKKLYALESWAKGNGIRNNHKRLFRLRAQKYGALDRPSPIDTMEPKFKYAYDLLPEAGAFRSDLVDQIHTVDESL